MYFIEVLKSVFLGVVEGITEWLPISSTGHMILVNDIMGTDKGFFGSQIYLYVIQLGAILAIATIYFKKLNPFSPSKTKKEKRDTWSMWFKVLAACVPAAVIGLLFNDYMDSVSNPPVVSTMLIVYGVAFIWAESRERKTKITSIDQMSYKTAIAIGLFQVLSIVPGTSRSGATILGAVLIGCSRGVAAEFSFFLAVPVMVGVSLLKLGSYAKDVYIDKITAPILPSDWALLLIGMAVAYVVSMLAVKFLTRYVRNHDFKAFGWYRIALGAVVIIYYFAKMMIGR